MNQLLQKFRVFVWPYLLVAGGFLLAYTFLHWLLCIRLDLFEIDEDLTIVWLPMGLAWIPVIYWFRRAMKKWKAAKSDQLELMLQFLLSLAIAIPTIVAQHYIIGATGKLSALNQISDIKVNSSSRYYTLQHYYIDKANAGVIHDAEVAGKYNENFAMYIYVVLPIWDKPADTAGRRCLAWYALRYQTSVSNRLSDKEKDSAFRKFAGESQRRFDTLRVDNFSYLEKAPYGQMRDAWLAAIDENKPFAGSGRLLLQPRYGSFAAHTPSAWWTILAFLTAFVIWTAIVVFSGLKPAQPALHMEEHRDRPKPPPAPNYSFLKPRKGYLVTPVLMYINLGIYLLMVLAGFGVFQFRADDLLNWGANYRPYTVNGQWWRLLTSTFLHGGLLHVASNMFGLVFAGAFLEPMIGSKRMLISYLAAGIVASAASIWWHPDTVSVGASGAIFGMFGICVIFLAKAYKNPYAKSQLYNILFLIGYNLLWGLSGGIDNAAHTGGLVAGLVIGLIIHPAVKREYLRVKEDEIPEEENLD